MKIILKVDLLGIEARTIGVNLLDQCINFESQETEYTEFTVPISYIKSHPELFEIEEE